MGGADWRAIGACGPPHGLAKVPLRAPRIAVPCSDSSGLTRRCREAPGRVRFAGPVATTAAVVR